MKLNYYNLEYTKPSQIADAFNDHFMNVGPKLADVNIGSRKDNDKFSKYLTSSSTSFSVSPTTADIVQHHLERLAVSKATGLDNIPSKILKRSADIISIQLANLFNPSISHGLISQ